MKRETRMPTVRKGSGFTSAGYCPWRHQYRTPAVSYNRAYGSISLARDELITAVLAPRASGPQQLAKVGTRWSPTPPAPSTTSAAPPTAATPWPSWPAAPSPGPEPPTNGRNQCGL